MNSGRLTKKESMKLKKDILEFCKGAYCYEKSIQEALNLTDRQIKYQLKYLYENGLIIRDPNLRDLRGFLFITNPQTAEGMN